MVFSQEQQALIKILSLRELVIYVKNHSDNRNVAKARSKTPAKRMINVNLLGQKQRNQHFYMERQLPDPDQLAGLKAGPGVTGLAPLQKLEAKTSLSWTVQSGLLAW
jgi:hypothetical protein